MKIIIPIDMNELQPFLEEHLHIDRHNLMDEYDRLLSLRSQLISVFILKKAKFAEAKMRFSGLRMKYHKEYKTTNPLRLNNAKEFEIFVNGSEQVREAQYAIDLLETEMKFIENQTKTLDERIWQIKAEKDVRKFEQGGGII